jgi:hypothetical protein
MKLTRLFTLKQKRPPLERSGCQLRWEPRTWWRGEYGDKSGWCKLVGRDAAVQRQHVSKWSWCQCTVLAMRMERQVQMHRGGGSAAGQQYWRTCCKSLAVPDIGYYFISMACKGFSWDSCCIILQSCGGSKNSKGIYYNSDSVFTLKKIFWSSPTFLAQAALWWAPAGLMFGHLGMGLEHPISWKTT